jgi:hypothetical protein
MTLDLRPLSLGELFDRAFMLYRRHFRLFVGITAVPGVFALLLTVFQQAFTRATVPPPGAQADAAAAVENLLTVLSLFAGMMVAFVIYWVVYMIALGAATLAVSEMYVGRPVTIASVYGRIRAQIGGLLLLMIVTVLRLGGVGFAGIVAMAFITALGARGAEIVAGLLIFFILLGLVALLAVMALRYSLSIPALVIEGLGPVKSIRRSIELTQGRLGRVFLMVLCATMVTYAALVLFQGPFFAAAVLAGLETSRGFWLNLLGGVFGTIGTTLTTPFMIIGLALIYYDARIREEALDVDLSLAALDGSAG